MGQNVSYSLVEAVRTHSVENVKIAIAQSADPNFVFDEEGKTPLHLAVALGSLEIAELLLNAGARVDSEDKHKCTPLHHAVYTGQTAAAELLLNRGANINAVSVDAMSPLHTAVEAKKPECVVMLLSRGADSSLKNAKGDTPVALAAKIKQKNIRAELVDILLGASPSASQSTHASNANGGSGSSTSSSSSSSSVRQPQQPPTSPTKHLPENEATKVRRLAGLCKVWGAVKHIHPYLLYEDVNWDQALLEVLSQFADVTTTNDYKAAIDKLLAPLSDPNTSAFLAGTATAAAAATTPLLKLTPDVEREQPFIANVDDNVPVIVATNFAAFSDAATDFTKFSKLSKSFQQVFAEAASAQPNRVILDVRCVDRLGSNEGGTPQAQAIRSVFTESIRIIITKKLYMPTYRQRIAKGQDEYFKSHAGSIFFSGALTTKADVLLPAHPPSPTQGETKLVIILNENTPTVLLDLFIALQCAGLAVLINEHVATTKPYLEGAISSVAIWPTPSTDQISVLIRKDERINPDGTRGFSADWEVDCAADENTIYFEIPALKAALAITHDEKEILGNVARQQPPRKLISSYITNTSPELHTTDAYPNLAMRLLALFRCWASIDLFFPYKNLIGEDWDSILREFIPKIEKAEDGLTYHLAVAELLTRTHDTHAYASSALINTYIGTHVPPLELQYIEGKTVVSRVLHPDVATAGVSVGDEVLAVDGVQIRIKRAVLAKILPASTSQSLDWRVHGRLLSGAPNSSVKITLKPRSNQGEEMLTVELVRNLQPIPFIERTGPAHKLLDDARQIGYIDTVRIDGSEVDTVLEDMKTTSCLIIDVRGHPKNILNIIASRLALHSVPAAHTFTPLLLPSSIGSLDSTRALSTLNDTYNVSSSNKWKYGGQVVILINETTMSPAEHACLFIEAATAGSAVFIGTATAGTIGTPTNILLPGEIVVAFSGMGEKQPNGKHVQRSGIIPKYTVEPTVSALIEGRDEILDSAVQYCHSVVRAVHEREREREQVNKPQSL